MNHVQRRVSLKMLAVIDGSQPVRDTGRVYLSAGREFTDFLFQRSCLGRAAAAYRDGVDGLSLRGHHGRLGGGRRLVLARTVDAGNPSQRVVHFLFYFLFAVEGGRFAHREGIVYAAAQVHLQNHVRAELRQHGLDKLPAGFTGGAAAFEQARGEGVRVGDSSLPLQVDDGGPVDDARRNGLFQGAVPVVVLVQVFAGGTQQFHKRVAVVRAAFKDIVLVFGLQVTQVPAVCVDVGGIHIVDIQTAQVAVLYQLVFLRQVQVPDHIRIVQYGHPRADRHRTFQGLVDVVPIPHIQLLAGGVGIFVRVAGGQLHQAQSGPARGVGGICKGEGGLPTPSARVGPGLEGHHTVCRQGLGRHRNPGGIALYINLSCGGVRAAEPHFHGLITGPEGKDRNAVFPGGRTAQENNFQFVCIYGRNLLLAADTQACRQKKSYQGDMMRRPHIGLIPVSLVKVHKILGARIVGALHNAEVVADSA